MKITLSEQLPDKNEYFSLYITTGWNEKFDANPDLLEKANMNSWLVIAAYDENKLVGFGRVMTDLVSHAVIYDLIVLPNYQRRGIGTLVLKTLVKKCEEQNIRDIQLFCAKGKRPFYERNGFEIRAEDAPGMQLKEEK